ncbi:MAG: PhnD/SsuA/transferrin family substrate-binding protein [Pseudomonadota bacterium]
MTMPKAANLVDWARHGAVAIVFATSLSLAHAQTTDETIETQSLAPPSSTLPPPAGLTLDLTEQTQGSASGAAEVFRIGFLADTAPRHQQIMFVPFRDHVEAVLNRPVEMIGYRDARGLMAALQRANIAYAMAPSSLLVAAERHCDCVTPLASQPNRDGSDGLMSVLIASREGGLRDIDDVDGKRLAIVGEGSVIAHRVGLSELWTQTIEISDDGLVFADSLAAATSMLRDGSVDAVLGWSRQAEGATLLDLEPANALSEETRSDLRIIWRSRPVPNYSHFARSALDPALIDQLQVMLVDLAGRDGDAFDAIDRGVGRPFEARTADDYAPLREAFLFWDRTAQRSPP